MSLSEVVELKIHPSHQAVLDILAKGPLNKWQAVELKIVNLTDKISHLRKMGFEITSKLVSYPGGQRGGKYAIYTLSTGYRRGQKKVEKVFVREYTCDVGEIVRHGGRMVLVTQVLEQGREEKYERAFIAACPFHPDGKPLRSVLIPCGTDWKRV